MVEAPRQSKRSWRGGNGSFKLEIRLAGGDVLVRLADAAAGFVLADGPYVYRLALPVSDGVRLHERLIGPRMAGTGDGVTIFGRLGPLELEHSLAFPSSPGFLEERIRLRNTTTKAVELDDFESGLQRRVTDESNRLLPELTESRLVAIPFKHKATDPAGFDWDFTIPEFLQFNGAKVLLRDYRPFPARDMDIRRRYGDRFSEGWAWTAIDRAFCLFKFNQQAMEFSAITPRSSTAGWALRFGGAAMIGGERSPLNFIEPGGVAEYGITRYAILPGGYREAAYAFRSFLEEQGCAPPAVYNPPVQWNELYDNPDWNLASPRHPRFTVNLRASTYTRALIEEEAAKAKDYRCEALYLDPGWDTEFGSFLWGEKWLGPCADFVRMLREKYGLSLALHCPTAPWMSDARRAVPSWPEEALVLDEAGRRQDDWVCVASSAYLDEAERRLCALCEAGARFFMFDGTYWKGRCHDPHHGHAVPYSADDQCRALMELCRRVHRRHPGVLVEMHDMIVGGKRVRYTPSYYQYGLPQSYDENWGFELMWDCMADIRGGRARSLFHYRMACSVPVYLHVDLRDDNRHCLVLWWFASTCQHLGIGGTHPEPQVAAAQKDAMRLYRRHEAYYKRGRFFCMKQMAGDDTREEEIHLHVSPDKAGVLVHLFNLSDRPRLIAGRIRVGEIGLDPDAWHMRPSKGCRFEGDWLWAERLLEPWSVHIAEVKPLERPD